MSNSNEDKEYTQDSTTKSRNVYLKNTSLAMDGTVAHDAVDSGNPVKVGGKATDPTSMPTAVASGDRVNASYDLYGRLITYNGMLQAGEDLTKDVTKVEQRFTRGRVTADGLVATGAGFLHTITISPLTATPTAGLLSIYDNTAESGTVIYAEWVFATTPGHSVTIDCTFGTGLYVGFDGTLANVACGLSYRL